MARVAATAVNIETSTPMASRKAKPLDAGLAGDEQHRRRDQRHRVGVDDRAEALRVARRDGRAHGLRPARTSSLMRSKMTTFASAATPIVRIMPAMPGQRHRHRYREDQPEEQRRVDEQREVGDDAQEPVEDDHPDHHDQQARDARDRGPARATSCRAWPRPASATERANSTGSEPDCSTSATSLASSSVTPVICAFLADAVRRALEVDRRVGLELAVEDDGELPHVVERVGVRVGRLRGVVVGLALLREVARDVLEQLAAAVVELHRHDGLAGLRVEVGARRRQVLAGEQLVRERPVRVGREVEHVPVGLALGGEADRARPVRRSAGRRRRSCSSAPPAASTPPAASRPAAAAAAAPASSRPAVARALVVVERVARRSTPRSAAQPVQQLPERVLRRDAGARDHRARHARCQRVLQRQEVQRAGRSDEVHDAVGVLLARQLDRDPVVPSFWIDGSVVPREFEALVVDRHRLVHDLRRDLRRRDRAAPAARSPTRRAGRDRAPAHG